MAITVEQIRNMYTVVSDADMYPDSAIQQTIDDVALFFHSVLSNSGCGYTPEQIDIILRYIVVHFLSMDVEQGGITRKRTGDSEEAYASRPDNANGLSSTNWGAQALMLDTCGALSSFATTPMKAQFRVV